MKSISKKRRYEEEKIRRKAQNIFKLKVNSGEINIKKLSVHQLNDEFIEIQNVLRG